MFWEGHRMHWIHAKQVGRTPWGWRSGTVLSVDGQWVTVVYTRRPGIVRLWHHEELGAALRPGTRVRVHEAYHALAGPFGWVNVLVHGGHGLRRRPRRLRRWARRASVPVVDLSTGRALAMEPSRQAS
jgi:hypothetical protein